MDKEGDSEYKMPKSIYKLGKKRMVVMLSAHIEIGGTIQYTYYSAGLRIWNDLFRIRIRIFDFWIADPDPTRVKGWRVIIMLVIASPPAKTTKILPEKIKNLIKIFSNKLIIRCIFSKPDPRIRIRNSWTGSATLHFNSYH